MKHLLFIFLLMFIGCMGNKLEARVVSKNTIESSCKVYTINNKHTVTCTEKKFFLMLHDNFSDDRCYVNETEYNETSIGTIYKCILKKN